MQLDCGLVDLKKKSKQIQSLEQTLSGTGELYFIPIDTHSPQ